MGKEKLYLKKKKKEWNTFDFKNFLEPNSENWKAVDALKPNTGNHGKFQEER